MSQPQVSAERVGVAFCPFCHESFEGRTECPEHELTLVPLAELPRSPRGRLDRVEVFADPRLGRGLPLLGASLVLLGFLAPFVRSSSLVASALEVAIDGAGNLWLTPGAALVLLSVLWRRRSAQAMSSARGAIFGLSIGGALPLIYTSRRISLVAESQGASVDWLAGLWLMALGLVLAALGSPWFGRVRSRPR
ncbi:MAG: hypothetical protein ACN4G0_05650 [Polyangiales bacterium]